MHGRTFSALNFSGALNYCINVLLRRNPLLLFIVDITVSLHLHRYQEIWGLLLTKEKLNDSFHHELRPKAHDVVVVVG